MENLVRKCYIEPKKIAEEKSENWNLSIFLKPILQKMSFNQKKDLS